MPKSPKLEWPAHIEGYVVNFLTKNFWRVKRIMQYEDAMQTCYVVYLRCQRKYPSVESKHMMSLYKTALSREWADLSNADTRDRMFVSENQTRSEDGEEFVIEDIGSLDNDGMLAVMIKQAPREVIMVLNLMLNAPQELLELASEAWRKSGHRDNMGSAHLSKMLGLPPNIDVMEKVQEYFIGSSKH